MDVIGNSLIVSGHGDVITAIFDAPLKVAGKKIGLKSLSYPELDLKVEPKYKFRVVDTLGLNKNHELALPHLTFQTTDEVVYWMHLRMLDLFDKLGYNRHSESIHPPVYLGRSNQRQMSSIKMKNSGFKILDEPHDSWAPEEHLVGIMQDLNMLINNNNNEFRVRNEPIELPLKKTQGALCYLFCNVIKPTFINALKRQILDSVYLVSLRDVNQIKNDTILFHKFAVDEILSISFYAQTPNGKLIDFGEDRHPFVAHLIIEDDY